MMRTFLATTAIVTLVAGGAAAQTTQPPTTTNPPAAAPAQPETPMVVHAEGHLATDIIGQSVYNGTGEDAQNIGKVTDVVIGEDGAVEALVVGVGGFLGIGQKEVALEYDLAEWSEQPNGDRWLVMETTKEALEAQQAFDRSAYKPMPADAEVTETKPATREDLAQQPQQAQSDQNDGATAPAMGNGDQSTTTAEQKPADEDQQSAQSDQSGTDQTITGAIDRSTLQQAQPDQIRSEELTGTAVYGTDDQKIGEIGDVVLTPEGDVDALIVDVGGFLGVGEKEVAIGMDNLAFMTDEDGDYYLFTDFTKEELEKQPAYDESSYTENRDQMRMMQTK